MTFCRSEDEPDAGKINTEARPVPGLHLQLHSDVRKGTGGEGSGEVLSDHPTDDTSDDPEP